MRPRILITALLAVAGFAATGCGGSSDTNSSSPDTGKGSTKLSLVAYSTPEVVYDEIIPAFQKTSGGKDVGFQTSYGASGEQSRAVESGLKADVVTFSLAPDVDRLVKSGQVAADWNATPTKGFVTTSEVAFIVRKGNPKGIRGWDDLLKPGVKVVTPNPFTSGAAKWNLLGAVAHGGLPFVSKLISDHVSVQPKSGRDALQAFTGGEGDVLLSYEYEYTTAVKKGEKDLELVRPDDTIRIENPIAVTKTAPAAAKAFVAFALSPAGQQHFADWGYRPTDAGVLAKNKSRFPDPGKLSTIEDLGGWDKVNTEYFDETKGSIAKIEQDAGVSTAK